MSKDETLARIPLFRSLGPDGISRLDAQCTWHRASAKEWVLDYEAGGTDLFFVLGATCASASLPPAAR